SRSAQTRSEEQAAEHPRIAPDRLVADAQQDTGIGRDEQGEDGADNVEGLAHSPAKRLGASPPIEHKRLQGRHRGEEADDQERPREVHHDVPRRLKATIPAITPSAAVTSAARYPPTSLRDGSPALAAFGRPYVSGLSISRKKAFSPP